MRPPGDLYYSKLSESQGEHGRGIFEDAPSRSRAALAIPSLRRCAIHGSERFWEQLLRQVEDETVVPILGPELLHVSVEGREALLYPLLADRLAERLNVSAADLPPGAELQEVARRYLSRALDVQEIYRSLRSVVREVEPIRPPRALVRLAEIPKLDLFVTTTFDVLTERAVDQVRFGGQRQTLSFAFAPGDRQDLPPEFARLSRPAVFHLMGRLSGTPHSYAVTREDRLEFLQALQSKREDAPGFLFDKLRSSNVLILGSDLTEWLAHVLVRDASGGAIVETELDDGSQRAGDASPVLFLKRSARGTSVLRARGASGFVDELHRRWHELTPPEEPEPPASIAALAGAPAMQAGVVLLSCAAADRSAAESIRRALDEAGVDAILDCDDVELAERWDQKLRSLLSECAVFLPVVSRRAAGVSRRFARPAWIEALQEASRNAPSGRFIVPVIVDGSAPSDCSLPSELGALRWETWSGGRASRDFLTDVVRMQRSYRSASFA